MRTIEEIIARNIIVRLDELGLDQSELAKRTKLSRKTINSIVNRKQSSIRQSTRDEIAKALGISRQELEHEPITMAQLAGIKPNKTDSSLDNRALRDRIRKLESIIEGIPERYLEALKSADSGRIQMFEALFGLEVKADSESDPQLGS